MSQRLLMDGQFTVAELIAELKKHPPEWPVEIEGHEDEHSHGYRDEGPARSVRAEPSVEGSFERVVVSVVER